MLRQGHFSTQGHRQILGDGRLLYDPVAAQRFKWISDLAVVLISMVKRIHQGRRAVLQGQKPNIAWVLREDRGDNFIGRETDARCNTWRQGFMDNGGIDSS